MPLRDESAHVVLGDASGVRDIFVFEELQELVQISPVGLPGTQGKAAFVLKIQDEFPGQFSHGLKLTPKQELRRGSS